MGYITSVGSAGNRLHRGSHGGSYANSIRVIASTTFDPVSWREKGVKALYQIWVTGEQFRDAINNTRSIDTRSKYVSYGGLKEALIGRLTFDS